jgi:hypothetical protein
MTLLLLNDHLLRRYWPSWWTGKLGDFAWLFFFPFALAVMLAWLIPPQVPRQEKIVNWCAYGLTGGVFVLAKTVPPFHELLVRTLERVLSMPVALVRDPTDSVALVALAMSWQQVFGFSAITAARPHTATANPATGNVIFAMGLEGVLVRTASGEWHWARVGGYAHVEPDRVDAVFSLLLGDMLLAIAFALLSILTLLRRLHPSRFRRILLGLFWIIGAMHAILVHTIFHEGFYEGAEVTGYVLTFTMCLVLTFLILLDVPAIAQHTPDLLKRLAVVGLSVAVHFLVPFVVWALDVVPEYGGVFCFLAPVFCAVALFAEIAGRAVLSRQSGSRKQPAASLGCRKRQKQAASKPYLDAEPGDYPSPPHGRIVDVCQLYGFPYVEVISTVALLEDGSLWYMPGPPMMSRL